MFTRLSWIFAIYGLVHLPVVLVPVVYWRCRNLDPIKNRRPRLLTATGVAISLFCWHQISRNLLKYTVGTWWDVVLGATLLGICVEGMFVFAISLYVAFNKTKDQIRLVNSGTCSEADLERIRRSIAFLSYLLSDQFALIWIVGNVLVVLAAVFTYAAMIDISALNIPMSEIESGWALPYCQYIIIGRTLITTLMFFALTFKLRIVDDVFGSKRMLRWASIGVGIGSAVYLSFSNSATGIPQFATSLTCDWVLIHAYLAPIRKFYWKRGIVQDQYSHSNNDFARFLKTKAGFAAFRDHLEKEFAVESLLFWRDTQEYRKCFRRSPEEAQKAAQSIHERYLLPYAPLEVNLPGKLVTDLCHAIQNHQLDLNTFDSAAAQIMALMECNSLYRFLNTSPPAWEQFIVQNKANSLMSDKRISLSGFEKDPDPRISLSLGYP